MNGPRSSGLASLIRPDSVAIVGASADPIKPGGRALTELRRFGYPGRIHLVNNRRKEITGIPCYPSVRALPEVVDLAIIAVPREAVLDAVAECVDIGVGGVLVYSSGFSELDADGAAIQDRLVQLARSGRTRIVGPNCQGLLDVAAGVSTSWADVFPGPEKMAPGPVAWVSQSGAIGAVAYAALAAAKLDINYWASTGNEADVTVEELINFVIDDPRTTLVCGHVESIADTRAFRATAQRARELGKPIILLKGGMTPAGAQATQSHTGALVGDTRAYASFFEQCGVILVRDLESLVATAALFARYPVARFGSRVAVVATSGGMGAIIADACHDQGLTIDPLSPPTLERARALLPPFIRPANPVDVATGVLSAPRLLGDLVLELTRAGSHDQVIACVTTLQSRDLICQVLDGLADGARDAGMPLAVVLLACHRDAPDLARERGLVAFTETVSPVAAMGNLHRWAQSSYGSGPSCGAARPREVSPPSKATAPRMLAEHTAKERLAELGLPVPRGCTGSSVAETLARAADLRLPVAAKLSSERLPHKTEYGAVRLGIPGPDELAVALHELRGIADQLGLPRDDGAVLVEEMAGPGVDMLVTLRKDAALGWIVVVATGGELVEVMDDATLRVLPVTRYDVESMVRQLRGSRLLEGVRGHGPYDIPAFVDTVLAICALVERGEDLSELELNPVRVHSAGEGTTILDALWIPDTDGDATVRSSPHGTAGPMEV